ncbi:T-cell leukemia/lymphoma protein 1B, partial [Daubentonia madagascariensis]
MASEASPGVGAPPDRLRVQRPGLYEDEQGRTWVTVAMRLSPSQRVLALGRAYEPSITVHTWQMPAYIREPKCPSQMLFSQLPCAWKLSPGRRCLALDSRIREIVEHGQFLSREQLVLTLHGRSNGSSG